MLLAHPFSTRNIQLPMSDTEDNPSIRQRFGSKVADKLKKQREEERKQSSYATATKKFKPRKKELGKIVLIAATKTRNSKPGDRVESTHRGKVFALYITKTGKIKPYRERIFVEGHRRKLKSKTPLPYSPKSIDPQQFPTEAARKRATEVFLVRGTKLVPPVVIVSNRNVRWHETVVPLVSEALVQTVKKATGGKGVGNVPMMLDVTVTVSMADGSEKQVTITDDFGQRLEQGEKGSEFYAPFLSRRTYAMVAERLMVLGVVTQGSSQRVAKANAHIPERRDWQWRGGPWHKRDLPIARISRVEVQPRLIRVTKGSK